MKTFTIKWSKADYVVYSICGLIMVGLIVTAFVMPEWYGIPIVGLIVTVLMWVFAQTPRSLTLTHEDIIIRHWVGLTYIRRADIVSVEHFAGPLGVRCFGYGGFSGMVGWFYAKEVGMLRAYVSDPSNMLIITRRNARPIVLSCEHLDELLAELKK